MDFQHRPGGKTGSGGVASSSESNRDRRERLRQLALETIDINKGLIANADDLNPARGLFRTCHLASLLQCKDMASACGWLVWGHGGLVGMADGQSAVLFRLCLLGPKLP
ncbi:hypothetical protein MC885_016491 [Smutsia gigantea]|nr:hypothetical protein MC885_016491 [Smutsia gigantea]